jgi:hypothetical protein
VDAVEVQLVAGSIVLRMVTVTLVTGAAVAIQP